VASSLPPAHNRVQKEVVAVRGTEEGRKSLPPAHGRLQAGQREGVSGGRMLAAPTPAPKAVSMDKLNNHADSINNGVSMCVTIKISSADPDNVLVRIRILSFIKHVETCINKKFIILKMPTKLTVNLTWIFLHAYTIFVCTTQIRIRPDPDQLCRL
jgi:hypothetical protein